MTRKVRIFTDKISVHQNFQRHQRAIKNKS